ncbi:hypothetical protein H9P43_009922 [Blastocladiella emersonii ATCC 22665]|nr:hypothetical protein H9P43_009922 [Blastocladiella emersonii ATCC 22665]
MKSYGHASRCCALIEHLLSHRSESYSVEAVTLAPDLLFVGLRERHGDRFTLRRPAHRVDAGVLQTDALNVDRTRSLAEAERFMVEERDVVVREEVALLAAREPRPSVILSDASFVAGPIARALGIPAVLCTNFTWDAIYLAMLNDDDAAPPAWLDRVTRDYATFTYWLCEAGALDPTRVPAPVRALPTTTIPVFGPARSTTASTREQLRTELGLTATDRVALLTFGGHETAQLLGPLALRFPGWTLVGAVQHPDVVALDPVTVDVPAWMRAADVVIGKMGYGTCAEVLAAGRPFLYVSRSHWAEEAALVRMMREHGAAIAELPRDAFLAGDWLPGMDKLAQPPLPDARR